MCAYEIIRPGVRDRALKALDRLTPFSPVLNRLVAEMAGEETSFATAAGLIEKDTVLAANVLRTVNSALYRLDGTVSSVRHAVAILGLDKLRKLALSLSVARMWTQAPSAAGWDAGRFNAHSVAAGVLSDLIAARADVDYPEGAFVAGLLHDVGKLLIVMGDPGAYVEVCRQAANGALTWTECESELLGITHAELSGLALQRWNLPAPIREAVAAHHDGAGARRLSAVVCAADVAVNALGHSIVRREPEAVREEVLPLVEQFEADFGSMRTFC